MFTLLTLLALPAPQTGDLVAIRVGRAETITQGTIEHALILIEGGKIIEIGEDLPVERGIPVLERPDWVAMPGLVDCHTRVGAGRVVASRSFEPQASPLVEIDPRDDAWRDVLELGVTTLGFYPEGNGVPGQAIALHPHGDTVADMLISASAYLKIVLVSNASSKKTLRDAFKKVDEHLEKVAKEKEKWEKAQEKKKKSSKSKKEDEEKAEGEKTMAAGDDDKSGADSDVFTPPVPDEKVKPFLDLRNKSLTAMMSLRKAADYLHLLDVIDSEKDVQWFLEFPLQNDIDFYEVADRIGERKLLVVTQPEVTLQTNSLRERNIPAELARAGAQLALTPRTDSLSSFESWLPDVGRLIGQGLAREAALAAVTLEPARALGLDDRIGSLEKGKQADIVFWSGDPFEPSSRVQAVLLNGRFVVEEKR